MSNFPSQEYGLINAIQRALTFSGKTSFKIGVGDDAALRICEKGEQLIFTADVLVQDIHFSLDFMSFEEVGYKAMVANISDCAAMASIPDSALIQLVFPKNGNDIDKSIIQLYKGINRASIEYNFPIIGGDLSSGSNWTIGVSMTGRKSADERLLFRKGASVGDDIWVTGPLGGSAAGLEVLKRFGKTERHSNLIDMHITPKAKVNDALILSQDSTVTTLTDISDGIGKECRTLAYENDVFVDIQLNNTVFSPGILEFSDLVKIDPMQWVVTGGEDYELLFTATSKFNPEKYRELSLIKIGKIVESGYNISISGDDDFSLSSNKSGWDHFINQ